MDDDEPPKIGHTLTQAPSDEEASHDASVVDVQRKRKVFIVLTTLTILILLGVILTVVLVVVKGNDSGNERSVGGSNSNIFDGSGQADTLDPVPAPTLAPTPSPTAARTIAPSPAPTRAPPTLAPVPDPTLAPVPDPTLAPVPDPTFAPVPDPTLAPVPDPTLAPAPVFVFQPLLLPTLPPTLAPIPAPTLPPTIPPEPTAPPVPAPTFAPTEPTTPPVTTTGSFLFITAIVNTVVVDPETLNDPTSPQALALEWLTTVDNGIWASSEDAHTIIQRYAVTVMDFALAGELRTRTTTRHVCDWFGITCNTVVTQEEEDGTTTETRYITDISWPRRALTGSIPEEIVIMKDYLERMDLAENAIVGSLPESLYSLVEMTKVYLHNNRLSGGISETGIANMAQLEEVYFGHNEFTGTIPSTWASTRQGEFSKPLRYLILHHNKFSGQIPTMLNWDRMFYMDLGNNDLTGSIPADIEGWWDLRHLYLNSNKLSGSIPSSFGVGAGNGRIIELDISDNQLTGEFPGDWGQLATMVYMDIKDNDFDSMDKDVCKMEVLDSGEMVEFQADCNICRCEFCEIYC